MVKLLITDLDDTLYPWISFFVPAFYSMAEEVSKIIHVDLETILSEYKDVHQRIGSVETPFATLKLPCVKNAFPNLTENELKKRLDSAFHRFNHERKHRMYLFPGVKDTLEQLYNAGITIVGYTESASENGVYRLRQMKIDSYFSKIYVSDSQSGQKDSGNNPRSKIRIVHGKKPSAEILKQIVSSENVQIQEVLYIGDSLTKDIFMAKQLGITSVLFRGQERFDPELYEKLVAITSWTAEDFANDARIRGECLKKDVRPDYMITEFQSLKRIIKTINEEEQNGTDLSKDTNLKIP